MDEGNNIQNWEELQKKKLTPSSKTKEDLQLQKLKVVVVVWLCHETLVVVHGAPQWFWYVLVDDSLIHWLSYFLSWIFIDFSFSFLDFAVILQLPAVSFQLARSPQWIFHGPWVRCGVWVIWATSGNVNMCGKWTIATKRGWRWGFEFMKFWQRHFAQFLEGSEFSNSGGFDVPARQVTSVSTFIVTIVLSYSLNVIKNIHVHIVCQCLLSHIVITS